MDNSLLKFLSRINVIERTINILKWDLDNCSSEKGINQIYEDINFYNEKLYKLKTSNRYYNLLDGYLKKESNKQNDILNYISNEFLFVNKLKKIPVRLYKEYNALKVKTPKIWLFAKNNNDYSLFKEHLQLMIVKTKEYYAYTSLNNIYDELLACNECNIKSCEIDSLFLEIKNSIKDFVFNQNNVCNDMKIVGYKDFELLSIAEFLLKYIGFDFLRGEITLNSYSITEKISHNDVRITLRRNNNPYEFIRSVLHEGGHALYEQNISNELELFDNGLIKNKFALHESQAKFFEKIIGENINFWIPIYDDMRKLLKFDLDINEFFYNFTKKSKSIVRLKSDELSYCMHIIMRYEIEKKIFNENYDINKLPDLWNRKIKEYFNLVVENDSEGILQDIHWSDGSFGYFPTYLLGVIYDGMILEILNNSIGDLNVLLKNKKIEVIVKFLIDTIYCHGGAYSFKEIIQKFGYSSISSNQIIDFFKEKYFL